MPLITKAEIEQRQTMLYREVARMLPGPDRDHVLAEIELLRDMTKFKRMIETMPRHVPAPALSSPPLRPPVHKRLPPKADFASASRASSSSRRADPASPE